MTSLKEMRGRVKLVEVNVILKRRIKVLTRMMKMMLIMIMGRMLNPKEMEDIIQMGNPMIHRMI